MYNNWLMSDGEACKPLRGDVADSEMSTLKQYMADKSLSSLTGECNEAAYQYRPEYGKYVCWSEGQNGSAIKGLSNSSTLRLQSCTRNLLASAANRKRPTDRQRAPRPRRGPAVDRARHLDGEAGAREDPALKQRANLHHARERSRGRLSPAFVDPP